MSSFLSEEYITEEEMARLLKLRSLSALKSRRQRGTNHPPYVEVGNEILYPKRMFLEWIRKQPVIWEVKSAS